MEISVDDLVVLLDSPLERVVRVTAIERWPIVSGSSLIEDRTARCHGTMIVFDRLVPISPASISEVRHATPEEIAEAERQDLLPPISGDGREQPR